MTFSREYKVNYILLFFIFTGVFLLFYNISYTDDYSSYELHYTTSTLTSFNDLGFFALEDIGRLMGFDFREFNNFAIFCQLMLYSLVFIKFKVNPSFGLTILAILNYVQLANQIRYFIAFPLFLLAAYYLLYKKRFVLGIILSLLSLSFHNGIITLMILYPIYYLFRNKRTNLRKQIVLFILIGLIAFLAFKTTMSLLQNIDEKYLSYTIVSASYQGMAYVLIYPLSIMLVLLYYLRITKYNFEDNLANFTIVVSFFPLIWIMSSFTGYQVINARYVDPFFTIWIISIYLLIFKSRLHFKAFKLFAVSCIALSFKYLLPYLIFGYSDIDKITLIWASKFV